MLSKYQITNVILSEEYTRSRKILKLNQVIIQQPEYADQLDLVKQEILNDESETQVLSRFESEDSFHWIEYYSHRAAVDLLTLGKVQPETMLGMSLLPMKDFVESVKKSTDIAKKINDLTIAAESELNDNLIPEDMI
jgi:hypothetical protein